MVFVQPFNTRKTNYDNCNDIAEMGNSNIHLLYTSYEHKLLRESSSNVTHYGRLHLDPHWSY